MKIPMQETGPNGHLSSASYVDPALIREELDGYYDKMEKFSVSEPKEILMMISSWSSRVNHIRMHIVKEENRTLSVLRTKTIDPFLSECQFQFKIWSRLLSAHQLEWDQSRGI